MPLKVETGTGDPEANSYAGVEFANEYLKFEPEFSTWNALPQESKERALAFATRSVDELMDWSGQKYSSSQALGFPRYRCRDRSKGYGPQGYTHIPYNSVPDDVRKAVSLIALRYAVDPTFWAPQSTNAVPIGISTPDLSVAPDRSINQRNPLTPRIERLLSYYGYNRANTVRIDR